MQRGVEILLLLFVAGVSIGQLWKIDKLRKELNAAQADAAQARVGQRHNALKESIARMCVPDVGQRTMGQWIRGRFVIYIDTAREGRMNLRERVDIGSFAEVDAALVEEK